MADTGIGALTLASSALLTQDIPVNDSGVDRRITPDQIVVLDALYSSVYNQFSGTLSPTAATDTYVTGSRLVLPAATGRGALKIGSVATFKVQATKTAAGAVAPIFTVRYGTAGTTADTAIAVATGMAQTAVIDLGVWVVTCLLVTVGSGTTATARAMLELSHSAAQAAGFGGPPLQSAGVPAVGSGFNSQTASAGLGLSVNTGTSAAWTISSVTSQLMNLA